MFIGNRLTQSTMKIFQSVICEVLGKKILGCVAIVFSIIM